MSGSLFGMHYEVDGMVYSSERNKKFLEDNDQPAFFKDWLLKCNFRMECKITNLFKDG